MSDNNDKSEGRFMGTRMRIAQIAPLMEAVPPKLYGGTERVVSWLTEALVEQGHDVTLFASGDSVTAAKLEPMWPRALRLDGAAIRDPIALHVLMLERVARRASEFDLLHFHLDYHPFSIFSRQRTPFVTTLHGRLDLPELQPVFDAFPNAPLVSISDAQRLPLPNANWIGTVHHGLPCELLKPAAVDQTYLAFLGRVSPEKGLDRAIQIAAKCGLPLKIAAKVDKNDSEYFQTVIRPLLNNGDVEFIGEIGDGEKAKFLSGALALLVPIDWPEPFGLVMIEAMACGAPVLAFNGGAVPEIVENGVTGAIVDTVEEAIASLPLVIALDRQKIRQRFVQRFSATRMANDYLSLYRSLLSSARSLAGEERDTQHLSPGGKHGNYSTRLHVV
jgi:glycosyltransferase involved in cell wall biosynthesis